MEKNKPVNSGVGFFDLLTIAFVVLKLVGVIDWSWWLVIAPSLITGGLAVLLAVVNAIKESISER
jgi:hypothetical protein